MASITCGSCKSTHGSVNEVRECYATKGGNAKVGFKSTAPSTTKWAKANQRSWGANEGRAAVRANVKPTGRTTAKMAWFIHSLTVQLAEAKGQKVNLDQDEFVAGWMEATFDEGSETIDRLKADIEQVRAERKSATACQSAPVVPDGRYAIRNEDGIVKFYIVNSPTEGRWAGYTFVDAQASDERHPIKNRDNRNAILAEIAKDVRGASELYGKELGKCGVCGRTLTDETSRARGIGPVCAENMGWM